MALMTGNEYVESLRALNLRVYMFGKKVENPVDDPILRPSVNSVKMTYDLAQAPHYQDLMTATSHLTGKRSTASPTSTSPPMTSSKRSRCSACWARPPVPASSAA